MTGCTLVGSLGWEALLQSISVWPFLQPAHLFQLPKSWEFFHLTSPDAVPIFPFPSFLWWHLTFSCLPLNITPDTPSGMNYWNFPGKISFSFLLATSNVLLFFLSFFFFSSFLSSMPCLQAALGAALTIRIRNLEAIRLLVNHDKLMTILKTATTWLDLCFRELHLHVQEGELYWGSLKAKRPIRRFWKIMNYYVKTAWQKGVGVEMSRGLIGSPDDVCILQMWKEKSLFWNFALGRRKEWSEGRRGVEI